MGRLVEIHPPPTLTPLIIQKMNGVLSSNKHHIHPTLPQHCRRSIPSESKPQAQCCSSPPSHLGPHDAPIFMIHQSVKYSLGHREALKHCHSLTAAHIDGSGICSSGLDPSRDVQVSTQHHCQHAAQPPFQPQPRCDSSTSSFRSAAVNTAPPYVWRLQQNA